MGISLSWMRLPRPTVLSAGKAEMKVWTWSDFRCASNAEVGFRDSYVESLAGPESMVAGTKIDFHDHEDFYPKKGG